MTPRALARRYAQALFDVARRSGIERRAADDLQSFAGILATHSELQEVFETPAVPVARKKALVEALLAAGGEIVPEVQRLLLMLAERVDPSIIAGVVAKVGSVVFDSSVTHQLERLRQQLRSQM